jgi:hypothetical protein
MVEGEKMSIENPEGYLIKCECEECRCENATPDGVCMQCQQGDHEPRAEPVNMGLEEKVEEMVEEGDLKVEEKPDDPSLLVWEPVAQKVPDEMPLIQAWRARTPVGWIVAAFQDTEGRAIQTPTGLLNEPGPLKLVGFTFVPDFGSNNMTKNTWE